MFYHIFIFKKPFIVKGFIVVSIESFLTNQFLSNPNKFAISSWPASGSGIEMLFGLTNAIERNKSHWVLGMGPV